MTPNEILLLLYIPFLSLAGFLFSLLGINKKIKRDYNYKPKVSILMSTYNQGLSVYETLKNLANTDYPEDKLEIIVIDDSSKNDTFLWIQKASNKFNNIIALKNDINLGKESTVLKAAKIASGEIFLILDSDCIFEKKSISNMISCYSDKSIGAVGGRISVLNHSVNFLTLFQHNLYYRVFFSTKILENYFRSVQVISGAFFSIKREIYFKVINKIKKRNFLGLQTKFGEDRALTQFVLDTGHLTMIDYEAICQTIVPENIKEYLLQQLRWRKGFFISVIDFIKEIPSQNLCSRLFFLIIPFFIFINLFVLIISYLVSFRLDAINLFNFFFIATNFAYFLFFVYSGNFKIEQPSSRAKYFFVGSISHIFFIFINPLITLFALLTLNDTNWLTREKTKLME